MVFYVKRINEEKKKSDRNNLDNLIYLEVLKN